MQNKGKSRCEILEKVAILLLTYSFPTIFSMQLKNINMQYREVINIVHQFFIESE